MSLYERVAELPLQVTDYVLEALSQPVSSGFDRRSTIVRLRGGGEEGVGEDVTYEASDHERLQAAGPVHDLAGEHTLGSFSALVGDLDLFDGTPPERAPSRHYRRWAFESAALDLALRQAGRSLGEALGRTPSPVSFVVSLRLGDPPLAEPVTDRLVRHPGLRFKLDPTSSWDPELIAELAATGAVSTLDLKGMYRGSPVDQGADVTLYQRVVEGFPEAWIEDPAVDEQTAKVLDAHRDRVTWDAPLHSVADIEALPWPPCTINVKPSRFGSVRTVLDVYDHCAAQGIGAYGGGQFELGPGRGQAQYLASLFHPEAPNDLAPAGYNAVTPAEDLPSSPLAPAPAPIGFRWG